ncbi:catalase [Enterococcus faecalis]|uniref:Catalase n=1 Tax=Enterococcus faecalis TaxID=1351 RepID=A0A974NZK2_ENTFL|nr:catalase [Enterococcus faecalis]
MFLGEKNQHLTTSQGSPVGDNQKFANCRRIWSCPNPRRSFIRKKLAHFNRERVPERVVHAKGARCSWRFSR